MRRTVIFGITDFAEVAKVYLDADSPYSVCAFTAHERYLEGRNELLGVPVVPFEQLVRTHPPDEYDVFVALGFSGNNRARTAVYEEVQSKGYQFVTYVSTRASHVGNFMIGKNSFVFENNVIQPFVSIGDNTILWSGNHIGHHSTIGNNCFLASHVVVSGHCTIGDNTFIGVNATLAHGVTVAGDSIIGAGALILKDTVPKGVYRAKATEPHALTTDQLKL